MTDRDVDVKDLLAWIVDGIGFPVDVGSHVPFPAWWDLRGETVADTRGDAIAFIAAEAQQ